MQQPKLGTLPEVLACVSDHTKKVITICAVVQAAQQHSSLVRCQRCRHVRRTRTNNVWLICVRQCQQHSSTAAWYAVRGAGTSDAPGQTMSG